MWLNYGITTEICIISKPHCVWSGDYNEKYYIRIYTMNSSAIMVSFKSISYDHNAIWVNDS